MYAGGGVTSDSSLNQFMQEDALRQKQQGEDATRLCGLPPPAAAGLPNPRLPPTQSGPLGAVLGSSLLGSSQSSPSLLRRFDPRDVGYGSTPLPVTTPGKSQILPTYSTSTGDALRGAFVTPANQRSSAAMHAAGAGSRAPPRLERPVPFFGATADRDGNPILPVQYPAGALRGTTVYQSSGVTARPSSALKQRELSRQGKRQPPKEAMEKLVFKNKMTLSGLGPTGIDQLRAQLERGDVYQTTQRDYVQPNESDVRQTMESVHVAPNTGVTAYSAQVSDSHSRIFG